MGPWRRCLTSFGCVAERKQDGVHKPVREAGSAARGGGWCAISPCPEHRRGNGGVAPATTRRGAGVCSSVLSVRGAAGFPCVGPLCALLPGWLQGRGGLGLSGLLRVGWAERGPRWGTPWLSPPICGFVALVIGSAPRGSERFWGGRGEPWRGSGPLGITGAGDPALYPVGLSGARVAPGSAGLEICHKAGDRVPFSAGRVGIAWARSPWCRSRSTQPLSPGVCFLVWLQVIGSWKQLLGSHPRSVPVLGGGQTVELSDFFPGDASRFFFQVRNEGRSMERDCGVPLRLLLNPSWHPESASW